MQKNKTTRLVIIGLLLALEIILTRFLSISTPIVRIGFGFLPVAMVGIMYGPLWAGATYALGDFIGAILFPIGAYFPGFTVTAFLSGLTFGLVLYKKPVTWKRTLVASLIVVLLFDMLLNTYWLYLITGNGVLALLPARLAKGIFAIPVQVILIPLVWNKVFLKLNLVKDQIPTKL